MTTIAARFPTYVPLPRPAPVSRLAPAAVPEPAAPSRWREMAARQANNLIVHIALNDTPSLLSLANVTSLPPMLAQGLQVLNGINFATGCLGLALSAREVAATLRNPQSTRADKVVDVGRLVLSDVVATGGALLPMIPGFVHHPVGAAVFVATQIAGIGADIAKTVYDAMRAGRPQPGA